MTTTTTHDTKRSEDVRARIALLSEIPTAWTAAVRWWSEHNDRRKRDGFPDRNAEYLLYQTLVGAWPIDETRAKAYMLKAVREAKSHTSWTDSKPEYEAALEEFVTALLHDSEFVAELERFVALLIEPGRLNSLSQVLIKLTAPGVPDIYQGNEIWDLSLVDPDNRRPVDFELRRRLLTELRSAPTPEQIVKRSEEGLPKLWVTRQTLAYRRRRPELFGPQGHYMPMWAEGPKAGHVVAFGRGGGCVTVAPRFPLRLQGRWEGTSLAIPPGCWRNEFTGDEVRGGPIPVADLLRRFPVALLTNNGR